MKSKMGLKRKFNGRTYVLVAVVHNKKDLMTYVNNQRKVGGYVRVTKDKWDDGDGRIEYTAWHGGYKK